LLSQKNNASTYRLPPQPHSSLPHPP
jgi:hypothetical protein